MNPYISAPKNLLYFSLLFILLFQFLGFGGHNAVKLSILREVVNEGQDGGAIEQQALALTGVGHIAKLVRGNAQLLGENLTVSACLVEHIHEVGVFKDVLHLAAAQKVFDILGDTCRNTAPFAESLPDFHRISGGLLLLQKQVHLVDVITGGLVGSAVNGNAVPHLIVIGNLTLLP